MVLIKVMTGGAVMTNLIYTCILFTSTPLKTSIAMSGCGSPKDLAHLTNHSYEAFFYHLRPLLYSCLAS
jgi:hypothetical protein